MSLTELARIHGTDKCDKAHTFSGVSYMDIYEKYISSMREINDLHVLEIGVLKGSSLRTWKDYFPNAKIFGLDVDPACMACQEDRIDITIGSQEDESILKSLIEKAKYFDIIIDDGSHINRMIMNSYKFLWNYLRPNGWYIIEDMGCSFTDCNPEWPGMTHNTNRDFTNDRADIDAWILETMRKMDQHKGDVLTMQFWPYMIFIQKAHL